MLALLIVFALYAPASRLMLVHDDAVNIFWMSGFDVATIFAADFGSGGSSSRPLANALWIATREAFGWHIPAITHMWNVWAHALNTALVAALAARLAALVLAPRRAFALLSALLFGLFPLSYQSVIWAGAVYHPLMAVFGLAAVHAALAAMRRTGPPWLLALGLVLLAVLCHEAGFLFGVGVAWISAIVASARSEPVPWPALGLGAASLAYPIAYRALLAVARFGEPASGVVAPLADAVPNALYFAQAAVWWLVALIRPVTGLTQDAPAWIGILIVASAVATFAVVRRGPRAWLVVAGAGWTALMASVPIAVLSADYVRFGPRLLYSPSIGIALGWAAVGAAILDRLRWPAARAAVWAAVAGLCAWSGAYVAERTDETARLTPALAAIDRAQGESNSQSRVALVNVPWWNAPTYPAFFIGAEGMPLYQHDGALEWMWVGAQSNRPRPTRVVRHGPWVTRDARWTYGQPGQDLDAATLRSLVLDSDVTYVFQYDPPGMRSVPLARVTRAPAAGVPLAVLAATAGGRVAVSRASASLCGGLLRLTVAWRTEQPLTRATAVFVHGLDAGGGQRFAADRDLLDGLLPLDELAPGMELTDTRDIRLPADVPAGTLSAVRLGAYGREDGHRLAATRVDGTAWDQDGVVVAVARECQ